MLAGTPGLAAHLGSMHASFWDRLDDGLLGIGLLSGAAARAALVEPLAAHGVSIDGGVLDAVVADSQHYPYFIQIWGRALWQQHRATGATQLTAVHLDAARPDVTGRVTDYYENRYLELDRSDCLAAAEHVAARFRFRPTLDLRGIEVRCHGMSRSRPGSRAGTGGPGRLAAPGLRVAAAPGSCRRFATSPASPR